MASVAILCCCNASMDSDNIYEVVDIKNIEIDCQMFVGKFLWCL